MTLTRVTGKVFASDAQAVVGGIGQFGSAKTGTPNPTTDIATIQALQAYLDGWGSAIISSRNYPPIEEVNGVLKTISYQACYLLQEGIPEYDINTEYSNTSIVKSISGNELSFYISLQNNNVGNALTDTTYWSKAVFTGSSPIGAPQITFNFNATLPENCIWLEGAAISRTTYSTLFGIYGTTYGEGDGTTTFNLPDCRNRVLWGATSGGYIEAGLPIYDHRHYIFQNGGNNTPVNADSYIANSRDTGGNAGYAIGQKTNGEEPSLGKSGIPIESEGIYGNSTTVQPPAIKVRVYTRYQ